MRVLKVERVKKYRVYVRLFFVLLSVTVLLYFANNPEEIIIDDVFIYPLYYAILFYTFYIFDLVFFYDLSIYSNTTKFAIFPISRKKLFQKEVIAYIIKDPLLIIFLLKCLITQIILIHKVYSSILITILIAFFFCLTTFLFIIIFFAIKNLCKLDEFRFKISGNIPAFIMGGLYVPFYFLEKTKAGFIIVTCNPLTSIYTNPSNAVHILYAVCSTTIFAIIIFFLYKKATSKWIID